MPIAPESGGGLGVDEVASVSVGLGALTVREVVEVMMVPLELGVGTPVPTEPVPIG